MTAQSTHPLAYSSLCQTCQRYKTGSMCVWEAHGEPVEGWVAKTSNLCVSTGRHRRYAISYAVRKCPLYVAPRRSSHEP